MQSPKLHASALEGAAQLKSLPTLLPTPTCVFLLLHSISQPITLEEISLTPLCLQLTSLPAGFLSSRLSSDDLQSHIFLLLVRSISRPSPPKRSA